MRWNIILECVGKDGKQSTITLGTIERLAGSTTAENLGVNLQESKQIVNRLQDTVVKQQLQEHCWANIVKFDHLCRSFVWRAVALQTADIANFDRPGKKKRRAGDDSRVPMNSACAGFPRN
jgi:hypothetical protein